MTYLDVIILLPVVYGIIRGLMRGIVKEVFALLGIILGIVVARMYADQAAVWLQQISSWDVTLLKPVSAFVLFIVVAILCNVLASLLTRLMKAISLNGLNRAIGGVFGALKWILILTVIIAFVDILDGTLHFIQPELKQNSHVWNYAVRLASTLKTMVFPAA